MNYSFPHSRFFRAARPWVAGVAVALFAGPTLRAAEENNGAESRQQATISPKAGEAFAKINGLIEQKNWAVAFATLDEVMKAAAKDSYDYAMASLLTAQTHLMRSSAADNDLTSAIAPMEFAIQSGYWPEEKTVEWKYILAQLYLNDKDYQKAEEYVEEWLAKTQKPTPEGYTLVSQLKIQRAQQDINNIDQNLIREALGFINKGLLLGIKPHEQLMYLRVICYQSLGEYGRAAEQLELMLDQNPQDKNKWTQLFGNYVQAENMLRAVLTIERAQEHGAMTSPNDYQTRVNIYYNLGRLDKTVELLEQGLSDGTLPQEKKNYDLWAFALQQMHRELGAVDVFKKEAEVVKDGSPYVQIGNLYFNPPLSDNAKALAAFEEALRRGGLPDEGAITMFAAHLAYETQDLEKAQKYAATAESKLQDPGALKQLKGLQAAIEDAIRMRDAEKNPEAEEPATTG